VIGAGVFGLSVAYACAARGLDVCVVEQDAPGAGASGGIVGALSPHVPDQWNPKKAFQLRALTMAPGFWAGVEAASGLPTGYAPVGRLMPLRDAEAVERGKTRRQDALQNWPGGHSWQVIPVDRFQGVLSPTGIEAAIHETLSARLFPRDATRALAAAVTARGGRIETGVKVNAISQDHVETDSGVYRAKHIVLAAGLGGFDLLEPLVGAQAGKGVKGQAALMAADLPHDLPVIFDDGLYILNHGQGRVAIGSTSEPSYDAATTTDPALDALIARARALCPPLADAQVLERWAAARPKARRRDPMLGPVPGQPGLYVALGGFKIGFGLAPLVGEVLANLLEGKPADLPPSFAVSHHL